MSVTTERDQIQLEEISEAVEDTLTTCRSLAERLGEINHQMVEYMDKTVTSKVTSK